MARVSLDRIQAALAIAEAQRGGAATPQAVKNDPPRVILSTTPAILVLVDGKPVLRQVEGSSLQRSEEHTSELQSLMRISYAVFCLKKKQTALNTKTDPS